MPPKGQERPIPPLYAQEVPPQKGADRQILRAPPRRSPAAPPPAQRENKRPSRKRLFHKRSWGGRIFWWTLRTFLIIGLWGGVALAAVFGWYALRMPALDQVAALNRRPSATLLAFNGQILGVTGEWRGDTIGLAAVPSYLPQAVIAIEDRRFYSHFGIDPIGILRAAYRNWQMGSLREGGSTLTQQLAKNLFLTQERTFERKIQELLLALWLEWRYSKEELLTAYLNRVYLGAGTYGVDAAARRYFGRPARDVTLAQAALIAGLLKAPSRFAPTVSLPRAQARAKLVLNAMQEVGFITPEAANSAAHSKITLAAQKLSDNSGFLIDWLSEQVWEYLGDKGQDVIVDTVINPRLQRLAEDQLRQKLQLNGQKLNIDQAALVAMRADGAVLALVGGVNDGQSRFNRATQAQRQAGSAFKPLVYLAALEAGYKPQSIIDDAPIDISGWRPQNYDGRFRGPITLQEALAESVNSVAIRLLQQIGVRSVQDLASRLGLTTPLSSDLSLALGTQGVTPLQLTALYASFAQQGRASLPYAITRIRTRGGEILYQRQPDQSPPTVSPDLVQSLNDMLAGVIENGTGKAARLDLKAAGKTGTTQDYRDAWFMGFSGDLVAGIWLGNDDNRPMRKVTGGTIPAQIWHDFMVEALKISNNAAF
jgi:penicillin-binding protein 1A